jgi:hypothetical protein
MDKVEWWEALKYGPAAVAALVAFWTAGLITLEVNRKTIRPQARSLLNIYMGFCLLLTAFSYLLVLLEKNSDIASAVGDLEASLAGKQSVIHGLTTLTEAERTSLNDHVSWMCNDVVQIVAIINARPPNDCQHFLAAHPPPPQSNH